MRHLNSAILSRLLAGIAITATASCAENCAPAPEIPLGEIKPGDLAFRRGEGIVSDVVLFNDADGLYSHIGIVVSHNDTLKVVHAVPGENDSRGDFDRVKIDLLADFFAPERALRGEIKRMEMTDSLRHAISTAAISKAAAKVKFDHNYNLADTSKLYCTELVQLIFSNSGIDLAEERITPISCPGLSRDYLMPSDIYKNRKLTTIFIY